MFLLDFIVLLQWCTFTIVRLYDYYDIIKDVNWAECCVGMFIPNGCDGLGLGFTPRELAGT